MTIGLGVDPNVMRASVLAAARSGDVVTGNYHGVPQALGNGQAEALLLDKWLVRQAFTLRAI